MHGDFPEWQFDSSLGKYDGKVYEDFFRPSEPNPLNAITADPYPDVACYSRSRVKVSFHRGEVCEFG